MGRPTKYNKKIAEKICSLIATDTYTVAEVCRMVKIHPDTYYTWIKEFSEFSDAIKRPKRNVWRSLSSKRKKPSTKDTGVHGAGTAHYYGWFR